MIELEEQESKAIIVEPQLREDDINVATSRLNELSSLCRTLGLEVVSTLIVPVRFIKAATLIGSGKIEELKELSDEMGSKILVFDFELSPTMQRNLENETGLCVIDRQEVIIQIFADRARTKEAVIQVELARLEYSLPRLTRKWTNLSQTRGGVRGSKGEGEKKLELDRRFVERQIVSLKADLKKVKKQRSTQRQSRMDSRIPKIAIVGYTNSGKSSLLNRLTKADVMAEDKLFATLDPVTRKLSYNDGSIVLLTDTVGFISDLPHHLIDSFRSTLEEATLADILLIVCDATHPNLLQCLDTTFSVLQSLDCQGKPMIVALNKMDAVGSDQELTILRFSAEVEKLTGSEPVKISVKTSDNLDKLKALILEKSH